MFTIIGGDGKEYGPVSADQIRAWIVAGRANLDTQAKAAGAADWHRLGDLPEFAPPGTALPPALPAVVPTADPVAAPVAEAPLAGRGARTGAALINAFLYFLSMIPGSVFTGLRLLKEHPELTRGVPLRPENLNLAALAPGLAWIYAGLAAAMLVQCIFLATRGQNIGQLIADVRVVINRARLAKL